jgi:hypothetical protein
MELFDNRNYRTIESYQIFEDVTEESRDEDPLRWSPCSRIVLVPIPWNEGKRN